MRRAIQIAVVPLLAAAWIVTPATAATITVCSSGCDHTLIQDAVDAAAPGDTIDLAAETFVENVLVTENVTIRGAGAGSTIVDGNSLYSVFRILSPEVTLSFMTIRNGFGEPGGGIRSEGADTILTVTHCEIVDNFSFAGGGGISSSGANSITTIDQCAINDNSANYSGGGIANSGGTIAITSNTISGNEAFYRGGGLLNSAGGQMTVVGSWIDNNSAYDAGGGVAVGWGETTITTTLISDNGARTGGGVFATGVGSGETNLAIQGSTIVSNGASYYGGGLYGYGFDGTTETVRLTNSTVTANTAFQGAGVSLTNATISNSTIASNVAYVVCGGLCFGATLEQTIVAGNQPDDCALGTVISAGHNLSGDSSCGFTGPTDLENNDPLLLPLADNGGPTPTHALGVDSPALDAAGTACEATDQRGVTRPQDGDDDGVAECDIGAFEFLPPLSVVLEADKSTLSWLAVTGAAAYEVYRGDLADLPDGGYGDCVSDTDPNPTDTIFVDSTVPDPGGGWFYLVGIAGTPGGPDVGTTSGGSPRIVSSPCP